MSNRIQPVRAGTAENLARLAHFRSLDLPEADELDAVAFFLLGDVGDTNAKRELWDAIRDGDGQALWYLVADDWDDRDLDDLTETQCTRLPLTATEDEVTQLRYEVTRERLIGDVERTVWLARFRAAEITASMQRHPAGSRAGGGSLLTRVCQLPACGCDGRWHA
jgi:hypothetical protein